MYLVEGGVRLGQDMEAPGRVSEGDTTLVRKGKTDLFELGAITSTAIINSNFIMGSRHFHLFLSH